MSYDYQSHLKYLSKNVYLYVCKCDLLTTTPLTAHANQV